MRFWPSRLQPGHCSGAVDTAGLSLTNAQQPVTDRQGWDKKGTQGGKIQGEGCGKL